MTPCWGLPPVSKSAALPWPPRAIENSPSRWTGFSRPRSSGSSMPGWPGSGPKGSCARPLISIGSPTSRAGSIACFPGLASATWIWHSSAWRPRTGSWPNPGKPPTPRSNVPNADISTRKTAPRNPNSVAVIAATHFMLTSTQPGLSVTDVLSPPRPSRDLLHESASCTNRWRPSRPPTGSCRERPAERADPLRVAARTIQGGKTRISGTSCLPGPRSAPPHHRCWLVRSQSNNYQHAMPTVPSYSSRGIGRLICGHDRGHHMVSVTTQRRRHHMGIGFRHFLACLPAAHRTCAGTRTGRRCPGGVDMLPERGPNHFINAIGRSDQDFILPKGLNHLLVLSLWLSLHAR